MEESGCIASEAEEDSEYDYGEENPYCIQDSYPQVKESDDSVESVREDEESLNETNEDLDAKLSAAVSLTLPGNQLSMSALSYLKKFKNCGNKAGALRGWKRLEEEKLKVHEKKALRGTDKLTMAVVALHPSLHPWDVDSIVIPLNPTELEKMPSYLICELANSPQLVKDVAGATCLARMGFRLFANITQEKKQELCDYLCRQGLTVIPHTSPHCLV